MICFKVHQPFGWVLGRQAMVSTRFEISTLHCWKLLKVARTTTSGDFEVAPWRWGSSPCPSEADAPNKDCASNCDCSFWGVFIEIEFQFTLLTLNHFKFSCHFGLFSSFRVLYIWPLIGPINLRSFWSFCSIVSGILLET